jgi:hypothetical protein
MFMMLHMCFLASFLLLDRTGNIFMYSNQVCDALMYFFLSFLWLDRNGQC